MADLVPGTPEYKDAYDKEMQRLEAEANKETKPKEGEVAKETETPSPKEEKQATPDLSEDVKKAIAEQSQQIEKLNKSVRDTRRWGHENALMVKKLNAELEAERKARTKPAILDANPGLEEAISHIAGPKEVPADNGGWLRAVSKAIPDVESLLADEAFYKKAESRKGELGAEWDDPFIAIRELSDLKSSHLRDKAVQTATEQARKDFEAKAKKRPAMEVPGGSGGDMDNQKQIDEAERIRTLPKAEFDKMRSRVLGM